MFASRARRDGANVVVDVAFTDRWGGVSTGERASLDLSAAPDSEADSAANWSRLTDAFGVDSVVSMRQVHGVDVVRVHDGDQPPPTCDALVTSTVGLALCVRAADCVPVVLADADAGVVGVAHAGRRGIAAGLLSAAARTMRAAGASRIEAWTGPHICGGCYEVPAELRREVSAGTPAAFCCTTEGTSSLDLGAAAVAQLVAAGCIPIDHPAPCTREDENLFSYRRQGADSGRLAGLVVLREAGAPPARA